MTASRMLEMLNNEEVLTGDGPRVKWSVGLVLDGFEDGVK